MGNPKIYYLPRKPSGFKVVLRRFKVNWLSFSATVLRTYVTSNILNPLLAVKTG